MTTTYTQDILDTHTRILMYFYLLSYCKAIRILILHTDAHAT